MAEGGRRLAESDGVERTVDGRHVVVNGRRWRASDPSIPVQLRQQLVDELMDARRAVRAAGADERALAVARARVDDAKVALGERGQPWWEPPDPVRRSQRMAATIRTLATRRGPGKSLCPSEVARIVASPDWRPAMDDVRTMARRLAEVGEIVITQQGRVVEDPGTARGAIRYRRPADRAAN